MSKRSNKIKCQVIKYFKVWDSLYHSLVTVIEEVIKEVLRQATITLV